MKNLKRKSIIVSIFLSVLACVISLFGWVDSVFAESAQDVKQNSGFAQALHLEGNWVRSDGGYKLVIKDVKPDGSLKASYYNPKKINVSVAKWTIEEDRLQLFVELRDTNYPGSTYTLVYAEQKDVLDGTYFLAVTKERYSIRFLRIPKGQN
ncbi:hypothetical protein [Desulfobacula sp.]|uniref:hypothetical protein n=1 Tax=Desulfobacula sp. TaxID=2593537 RepID=UPI002633BFF8|nr:hypothetical protein [Desulfobacula sp.]